MLFNIWMCAETGCYKHFTNQPSIHTVLSASSVLYIPLNFFAEIILL